MTDGGADRGISLLFDVFVVHQRVRALLARALTSAGREAHAAVENATDRAASRPWARLAPETTAEIVTVLTPLAQACASVLPYPSPIGVPAPGR